jgi:hypothetical protein
MDEAFCARMLKAIIAGLESAPMVWSPRLELRTPNLPTEPWPLASSLSSGRSELFFSFIKIDPKIGMTALRLTRAWPSFETARCAILVRGSPDTATA